MHLRNKNFSRLPEEDIAERAMIGVCAKATKLPGRWDYLNSGRRETEADFASLE